MADNSPEKTPTFALPIVEQEVIDTFERHTPSFDELFRQLQSSNPNLTMYLMRRTAKLAPDSIIEKELYARVALELASLLTNQKIIDDIGQLTDVRDIVAPNADEYGDGEVQPPAA